MQKNEVINLKIEDVTLTGSGVGKHEGIAVFVPNAVIGDVLKVKILKVKSNLSYGKIEKILVTSDKRIDVDCPYFLRCGGCSFRNISYLEELKLKENTVKNNLKRLGNIEVPFEQIFVGNEKRYRNKAQFPVAEVNGEVKVGFFSNHTHRIVPCDDCLLQPAEFSFIAKVLIDFINKFGISVYNEETGKGLVRHLYIRKAVKTEQIMVCLVINGNSLPNSQEFCKMLLEVSKNISSVIININTKNTNVIMGEKCLTLYGYDHIVDVLCGVKVKISPLSFYQVNHFVAEKLYEKAAEFADVNGKTVIDLYCGAGTIGLSMAKKAKKIFGVEIVPEAVEDAKSNAEQNGINNAEFFCGDAKDAAKELHKNGIKPDVVIVDPPRKGCYAELIDTVCNGFKPQRVVYVSCDSATLARDAKIFEQNGYKCQKVATFDMFPRTGHVETVALFNADEQ